MIFSHVNIRRNSIGCKEYYHIFLPGCGVITETQISVHRVLLLPFIVLLQNKHTILAENVENLISAQPRISAHFQGPKALRAGNRINTALQKVQLVLIFFRLLLSNCLNWKIHCDDHSSLSSTTAVQIWIISYTSHHGQLSFITISCRFKVL